MIRTRAIRLPGKERSVVPSARRRCRALTMTELLTVASVIAILASMMSPVLLRFSQEAGRIKCSSNLSQINQAVGLVASQQGGKLPRCFDGPTGSAGVIDESSWWYRKVARITYPTATVDSVVYDQLTVPQPNDAFWTPTAAQQADAARMKEWSKLKKFDPQSSFLRCPASRDYFWERYCAAGYTYVTDWNGGNKDKDRVYDDNYGYNNHGFTDTTQAAGKQRYGFIYTAQYGADVGTTRYNIWWAAPSNVYWGSNTLYHAGGSGANRSIQGGYYDEHKSFSYIGGLMDMREPAQTILMVDYLKADAAPAIDGRTITIGGVPKYFDGYVFRHGGKLNVMFVDGHVEAYRERMLRDAIASDSIHGTVKR
jgi:prepilin-type processing-associated H-X9-DG protein